MWAKCAGRPNGQQSGELERGAGGESSASEQVVVVDTTGAAIGVEEKLRAHADGGVLHLAFCVWIFNPAGALLLQRRADCKYHFARLWSNTCCGHPRPQEGVITAARRRLGEEFGFTAPLHPVDTLLYHADDPMSGLAEREYAHVLVGCLDPDSGTEPAPAAEEIGAWCWDDPLKVRAHAAEQPGCYTPWFRRLLSDSPVAQWAAAASRLSTAR